MESMEVDLIVPCLENVVFEFYTHLAHTDVSLQVKAAQNLVVVVNALLPEKVRSDLIPFLQETLPKLEEPVQLLLLDQVDQLLSCTGVWVLLETFLTIENDNIRKHGIALVHSIVKQLSREKPPHELVAFFNALCKNQSYSSRVAAVNLAPFVYEMIAKDNAMCERVLTSYATLMNDSNPTVKSFIALGLSRMESFLGKERTIQCIIQLLRDDCLFVRLDLISCFGEFDLSLFSNNPRISTRVTSTIVKLSTDEKWRIRSEIIDYIPRIIKQMGKEFFNEKLFKLCLSWLRDPIAAVRQAAVTNMKKLSLMADETWTKSNVVPKVIKMAENKECHIQRLTALSTLTAIADVFMVQEIKECIFPTLTTLSTDPVPNIRLNVAKSIEIFIISFKNTEITQVMMPLLNTLTKDTDGDVVYFAKRAIDMSAWNKPNL